VACTGRGHPWYCAALAIMKLTPEKWPVKVM
jgi:hypothetical protein